MSIYEIGKGENISVEIRGKTQAQKALTTLFVNQVSLVANLCTAIDCFPPV